MTHGAPSPYYPPSNPITYENTKTFMFGTTNITLPALKVNNDTVIYVLNIMGGHPDNIVVFATDLLYGFDTVLSKSEGFYPIDGFISVEGKAIHLVYEVASQAEMPYVILRKNHKPYMGKKVISEKIRTITTGNEELYLDNKDLKYVENKRLVFIDDVISSGATLEASQKIIESAGGKIVACMAMALEGKYEPNIPSYFLAYLPVIKIT